VTTASWTFLTSHAGVLLCTPHDPGSACATSRPGSTSPSAAPTARHRPGPGRLHRQSTGRPPQPLPDPGASRAARTHQPGADRGRDPGPPRRRRLRSAVTGRRRRPSRRLPWHVSAGEPAGLSAKGRRRAAGPGRLPAPGGQRPRGRAVCAGPLQAIGTGAREQASQRGAEPAGGPGPAPSPARRLAGRAGSRHGHPVRTCRTTRRDMLLRPAPSASRRQAR
jgi:hypothetical protein